MNSEKSKARVPQGLRPPPGFPSGVTVPTGPRASMQTKKLPPGPLKLGNRHIPSVLSPVSCTKMSYEEAVKDILKQTGPHLARLKSMPSIETSVVLYDPRGGVLKACEGLHLNSDVSLCYLITWLQIFADNHVAKYHPGIDVVVRSVEIRFRNNQAYMSYPNLEGGLSYYNSNGIATACVNWSCDNSLMEQYWEVFRSAMQIGSDDQTKYPVIRVKTVKYLAGDSVGMKMKKPLGGGHVFVINEEDLDVHQYFDRYGQQIPDSLIQLDQWLTQSENKQISQELADAKQDQAGGHSNPAQPRREGAKQAGGNNALDLRKSQLVQSTQGKQNTSPKITVAKITSELLAETGGKTKVDSNHASNAEDLPDNYHPVPNRQQLSKVVTIPFGDTTVQIPVPFRPPVHPDPGKNWRRFQRSGGISQLHDAFPLDHLVFDPKDMPEVATPPPIISIFDNGGQSNQNTGVNNRKATKDTKINNNKSDNTDSNKVTTGVTRDMSDPYEAAVGFSSDDDEAFFPARNMKENVTSADINRLPQPIHRHGHRPSQNDTTIKDRKMHNKLPQGGNDVVANPIVASHKAPNKFELPKKKLTSTMNVNAPEFVNKSTSAWPPSGMEFMMNPLALGFAGHHLSAMGLPSMTMEYHPPPFPQLYLPPPMAMPGPFAPHPRPYPPRVLREPNFWAHPVYRTNPVAAAKPIANISKLSSNNNTRKQHIDHRGGRSKGSAALSNTIDELTRQVAQQTVERSIDGEVKNEGFSKKTDDKTDTSHKSSSAANSKAGRGTKKEMS